MSERSSENPPSEVTAKLSRIERRLDEIQETLASLQLSGGSAPASRDVAGAMRRLGVAVWAAGLLAMGAGSWIAGVEASRSPRVNVCGSADADQYDECLREPSGGEATSLLESLRRRIAGAEVAKDRVVTRSETARYSTSLRRVAGAAVAWTVVAFGSFAVLAWIARGLRPRHRAPPHDSTDWEI